MIPEFDNKGNLPEGIHICSGEEFLKVFCSSDNRKYTFKAVCDIFDFAKDRGGVNLFIGGSFITENEHPNDLDCLIVFSEDSQIPHRTEKIVLGGLKFDILYSSLESPKNIDAYIKLFSSGRFGTDSIGLIQIDLYNEKETWEIKHYPSEGEFEIIKRAYAHRSLIDINEREGIIVSIHGLYSFGIWNKELAPIFSSQGFTFAPFIYETNKPNLLFQVGKRTEVIDAFREFIFNLKNKYEGDISIIAHSFGTYIIAEYLDGFDNTEMYPVQFNTIILSGSIVNPNYSWEKYRGKAVGKLYNMISPNDEYVKFMPNTDLKKFIGMSRIFGDSGVTGFKEKSSIIHQSTNSIFTHTNTFKPDIIETKWLPFIKLNKGALYRDYFEKLREKADKK